MNLWKDDVFIDFVFLVENAFAELLVVQRVGAATLQLLLLAGLVLGIGHLRGDGEVLVVVTQETIIRHVGIEGVSYAETQVGRARVRRVHRLSIVERAHRLAAVVVHHLVAGRMLRLAKHERLGQRASQ